ncbi:MAG: hypothetical protein AVDCRST_MAG79-1014, partial [uncultured Thermoleophilia bacterium]
APRRGHRQPRRASVRSHHARRLDAARLRRRERGAHRHAGSVGDLHRHAEPRGRSPGRPRVDARRGDGRAPPRRRRGARPLGAADVLRDGVRGRPLRRRRLPDPARPPGPAATRRVRARGGAVARPRSTVPPGGARQRLEPEGRALLPGLPAAVRRSVPRRRRRPGPRARPALRAARGRRGRRVRPRRGRRRGPAAPERDGAPAAHPPRRGHPPAPRRSGRGGGRATALM